MSIKPLEKQIAPVAANGAAPENTVRENKDSDAPISFFAIQKQVFHILNQVHNAFLLQTINEIATVRSELDKLAPAEKNELMTKRTKLASLITFIRAGLHECPALAQIKDAEVLDMLAKFKPTNTTK